MVVPASANAPVRNDAEPTASGDLMDNMGNLASYRARHDGNENRTKFGASEIDLEKLWAIVEKRRDRRAGCRAKSQEHVRRPVYTFIERLPASDLAFPHQCR